MPRGINDYDEGRIQGRNVANANSSNIVSPGIVTDGLVLHLDAGNFASFPAAGTTWYDLSDSRTNGTLTNGPTFSLTGGGSVVFDGLNDFVNCGTGLARSGEVTVGAWCYPTRASATQALLARSGGSAASYVQNYVIYANSSNKFVMQTSANSYRSAESTTLLSANKWFYIVGTYNAAKLLSIYVNGVFEASSAALTVEPPTTGNQYVTLGANDGLDVSNRLQGNIAIGQIYFRALTPAEIQQNYNATRARFNI